jgi:hypothetical protein
MAGTLAALRSVDARAETFLRARTFTRASIRHAVLVLLYAGPVAGYEKVTGGWASSDVAGLVVALIVGSAVLAAPAAAWRAPAVYRWLVRCLAVVVTAAALMTVIYAIGLFLLPLAAALWAVAARPPRRS